MADRRRRRVGKPSTEVETEKNDGGILGFARLVLWVFVIAFVLRSFIAETFWIPSSSMEPTLEVGDYIFVTKWTYGYNRHSLMFDPPIFKEQRFWSANPERGDIVVFDSTTRGQGGPYDAVENGGYHVIKRVIGLPGDQVVLNDGLISVTTQTGEVLTFEREEETRENVMESRDARRGGTVNSPRTFVRFQETNPEGRTYTTREILTPSGDPDPSGQDSYDMTSGVNAVAFPGGLVPEGHVFVMGDNRDRSGDSRASLRSVPMYKIIGRARLTVFSLGENWMPRWGRFFKPLK